ncbi:hypothetical protein MMC22_007352 [Lobaria immixta]|nr:hypothetical protein [Lobaria immixta]
MTDASRLKATVYVGGLDKAVDERILTDAFLPFGVVVDVTIPKPEQQSSPEPHRGFGYIEFEIPGDAKEAIENMDQSELYGRVIKVAAAKPQKESNEGLGSKTAIWEQEGWLATHAVSDEDRLAAENAKPNIDSRPEDPMRGLEGLDVAGPKLA